MAESVWTEPLEVPRSLLRNLSYILEPEHGLENTGQYLIELVMRRTGLDTLEHTDVLDVGCGSRIVAAIINRNIPIKSYSGIEIHKPTVDFLNEHVAKRDSRFAFAHWDARNRMQNPNGQVALSEIEKLPFDPEFDLIWLFSVFTHLDADDATAMLSLLRRGIKKGGRLFFSAFVDDNVHGWIDKMETEGNAYYGKSFMFSLIEQTGWQVDGYYDQDPKTYIQNYLVCSPTD